MKEAIYFSHQGVSVSSSQFIVNGKEIAIHNVTTVESRKIKPELGFARVCLFGGLGLLFANGTLPIVGVLSIIYGTVLWFLAAPKYSVIIHTVAGDIQALVSNNSLDAENVLTALNVAIALRGSPD
jgi:hypothetical protein